VYIPLAKGDDPIVQSGENGFAIGRSIPMRKARVGGGIVMIATGAMTTNFLSAAELLAQKGVDLLVCISTRSSRSMRKHC